LGFFIEVGDFLSEFVGNVSLEIFFLASLFFNFIPLVANKQSRLSSDATGLFTLVEFYPFSQDTQKLKKHFDQTKKKQIKR